MQNLIERIGLFVLHEKERIFVDHAVWFKVQWIYPASEICLNDAGQRKQAIKISYKSLYCRKSAHQNDNIEEI